MIRSDWRMTLFPSSTETIRYNDPWYLAAIELPRNCWLKWYRRLTMWFSKWGLWIHTAGFELTPPGTLALDHCRHGSDLALRNTHNFSVNWACPLRWHLVWTHDGQCDIIIYDHQRESVIAVIVACLNASSDVVVWYDSQSSYSSLYYKTYFLIWT
jgi:hypothetical protein